MIYRSTKHSLKFTNSGKKEILEKFRQDYRKLANLILNFLWKEPIQSEKFSFNILNDKLNIPSFLDNEIIKNFPSPLTQRMKSACAKQVVGIIKSATEKRRKQIWALKDFQKKGINPKKLQAKIDTSSISKPDISKINPELDKKFVDFSQDSKTFDYFIQFNLGLNPRDKINIPVNLTDVDKKWQSKGKLLSSISLGGKYIKFIYEVEETPKKSDGETIGCDQGYKTVATFSDGQTTQEDNHGHNLETIQNKLSRKRKGSKAFKRSQSHRKNYINWSLNQIDFSQVKQVNFEKVRDIRKYKSSSRLMSHWCYTLIKEKLVSLSETEGFDFIEVSNEFRSQRCSECGWVLKKQRRGKLFHCASCGYANDADFNASRNLSLDLPKVPVWVRLKRLNRQGFFWHETGLFNLLGQELRVPDSPDGASPHPFQEQ